MDGNTDHYRTQLQTILQRTGIILFEYAADCDELAVFGADLEQKAVVKRFSSVLKANDIVAEGDRWKAVGFFSGTLDGPVEIDLVGQRGIAWIRTTVLSPDCTDVDCAWRRMRIDVLSRDSGGKGSFSGYALDVTAAKLREKTLETQAQQDPLTGLYNQAAGRRLVDTYLDTKNPYDSCCLLIIDVDFFKNANDLHGHQFGDEVLVQFADMLRMLANPDDVLMRLGGDEFAVFAKGMSHPALLRKASKLVSAARDLVFPDHNYSVTCSVGACFLPENVAGYTFDQLFGNADWALYRAKENGRNRCEFCDHLQRYEHTPDGGSAQTGIDTRYLHGDIVSTAFEVFEKNGSFSEALKLLMEVVGIRFALDRITVIDTDIRHKQTQRIYQWTSDQAPEALQEPGSFTKEDFLTLFNSYDEHGTTVLQHDAMDDYSSDAVQLLMQGGAKTVLYAAMYCEGRYMGAISYVTCTSKRHWSRQDRARLGELTKIVSAHLAKERALNASSSSMRTPEYDPLTGLPSFHRFREEAERLIVGGNGRGYAVVCSGFENFDRLNREYGFSAGDALLKEFAAAAAEAAGREETGGARFVRVEADRFVLLTPCTDTERMVSETQRFNARLSQSLAERFPKTRLAARAGIFMVGPEWTDLSAAMDAANYARTLIAGSTVHARLFDDDAADRRAREHSLEEQMDTTLLTHRLRVFLQPRVNLADRRIVGAEALVRWRLEDGELLLPAEFLPLCERNGKVVDLDLLVLDQVAAYLERMDTSGAPPLSVSVNASILHASDKATAERYRRVLANHNIAPDRIQVELTEADVVASFGDARKLFSNLQETGIETALDNFGTGRFVLGELMDVPVNTVKIGRALTAMCTAGKRGLFLVEQVVSLMKGLGYRVACEGIETEEQANALLNIGCEEGQGFLFSRPIPIEDFEHFARSKAHTA